MTINLSNVLSRVVRMVRMGTAQGRQEPNVCPGNVAAGPSGNPADAPREGYPRPLPVPYPAVGGVASASSEDTFSSGGPESTFQPGRHYSGVRLQQGRVQTDDDWNEQGFLNGVGDDTQLANLNLQDQLQKQERTTQLISNIMKLLHDTAKAQISNMR